MPNWDYSWAGMYYVTICTGVWKLYFGEIVNKEMILSELGIIATECWLKIPEHFRFVRLGEFLIMPNHIHGLIEIKHSKKETHPNNWNQDELCSKKNKDKNKETEIIK
jgi:REP element-mobilizing transposase RayT